MSVAVGELCDKIHGYDFKRLGCRGDVDFVRRGYGPVCNRLILLALSASFDIVFDPFGHSGPPGNSFGGVDGPVSSYVCCCRFVVYQL